MMVGGDVVRGEGEEEGGILKSSEVLKTTSETKSSSSSGGGDEDGDGGALTPLIAASEGEQVVRVLETRKFVNIMETRVTGFAIHAMILCSLLLLPLLSYIPIPVISGIFLYLGRKIMKGNTFFDRIGDVVQDEAKFKSMSAYRSIDRITLTRYLATQSVALAVIWILKSNKKYSILFPACIGVLALVRRFLLPRIFSPSELNLLDPLV
jgi:hypothetical protein